MSLDDRLRGAYGRRLHEVRQSLDRAEGFEAREGPVELDRHRTGSGPTGRWLAVAAGIVLALVGAGFLLRSLTGSPTGQVRADQTPADQTPADQTPADRAEGRAPETTIATLEVETTGTEPTAPGDTSTTATPATSASSTAPTAETTNRSTTSATPVGSDPVAGVANSVCPGGARAELEWAALRYVGQNRGWGRKDDLVDEQDGPWYFEAWEPNYDEPVSVEIILNDPVLADEVRVAQDPFTPVGGIIEIESGDLRFGIELSGTDGWRVHRFEEPTLVERFTITRNDPRSNIMEVLLCVADADR